MKQLKNNALRIRTISTRTREQAAVYAGISTGTLQKIERGDLTVQLKTILNLAFSYGVSATELLPGLRVSPGREMRFDHEIQEGQQRRAKAAKAREKDAAEEQPGDQR